MGPICHILKENIANIVMCLFVNSKQYVNLLNTEPRYLEKGQQSLMYITFTNRKVGRLK